MFEESGASPPRYLVLSLNRLGLANRLRAMADWHQLATHSNRVLLVSWEPTSDCNASFTDLFKAGPPGMKILPFVLPQGRRGLKRVVEVAADAGLTASILSDDQDELQPGPARRPPLYSPGIGAFVMAKERVMSDTHVLVTDHNGLVVMEDIRCQQYLHMHSAFLSGLVPIDYATSFVRDFKTSYAAKHILIGVHVRVHDPVQDWAVVPPLESVSDNTAVNFGVGATIQDFTRYMRQIEDKFSSRHARFFIASNSQDAKTHILSQFPDAVSLSGDYARSSPEGVIFALIEWLLLSESSLILNTYGSSFAVEAAQVHMRPLLGLWDGRLLHHYNHYLPHCGHLLYAKAYGNQGAESSYFEVNDGTNFRRAVVSKTISMKHCAHLQDWGLPEVYCVTAD